MISLEMLYPGRVHSSVIEAMCHEIWPMPYAADAAFASVEDGLTNPTGQVFFIKGGNYIIGITGFFDPDPDCGNAYLRWTGVLPQYRGTGAFRAAIELLKMHLKGVDPRFSELIELVPDNEYGQSIVGAFTATGWVLDSGREVPEGEDADWPVKPYVLSF